LASLGAVQSLESNAVRYLSAVFHFIEQLHVLLSLIRFRMPIQNLASDSGTRDLLKCVERTRRKPRNPALGTFSDSNTG